MSKKNKKNNRLNIFTEEELKDLELTDDGILEVGFGEAETGKKTGQKDVDKSKQKIGATAKKSSELDKRVAAILKRLDIESDEVDEIEPEMENKALETENFEDLMKLVNKKMSSEIDTVASDEVANKLKREFCVDDELSTVRKLASQMFPGIAIHRMLTGDKIRNKMKELKNCNDFENRKSLKKEIAKLQNENKRLGQIIQASRALSDLERLEEKVKETKKRTLKSDLKELYNNYGAEAIEELLKAEG